MTSDRQNRHCVSRLIAAEPGAIYDAFVTPEAVAAWLPPKGARGTIIAFDPVPGGAFRMILTFAEATGKSGGNSDEVDATFVDLVPAERVTLTVRFVSDRPEFAGTMRMTWQLEPQSEGTLVTCVAEDVPRGINRSDHELGMASSLANLAEYLDRK